MNGIDYLILLIVAVCVIAAVLYIRRQKKRGVRCIGCPAAGTCPNRNKGGCNRQLYTCRTTSGQYGKSGTEKLSVNKCDV